MCRLITILMMGILLASCSYSVPRNFLPYPVSTDRFEDPVKTVAIPLPIIASSPNEGLTVGALNALMFHNANDEVSTLIVPQVNYNDNFGVTTSLFGAFYPSPERSMRINASNSSKVNKLYKIRYRDEQFLSDSLELNLTAFDYTDGSARFFGFHSDSSTQNETNYSDQELAHI